MSEDRLISAKSLIIGFRHIAMEHATEAMNTENTVDRLLHEHKYTLWNTIADHLESGNLGLTVDAVPREEYESLLKRFRHLLESDYIRSFDEVKLGTGEYKRDIREAGRVLMVDSEPVVRCGECEYFCQYAQGFAPRVENADGDCYIRLVHSEAHPQFSAVRKNDYCSMGAKKEVLKDEFHQHNEVT